MNFLQPVFQHLYLYLDSLLPQQLINKSYVSNEMKKILEEYFSSSNKLTQQLTGLDLKQLNYPIIDSADEK